MNTKLKYIKILKKEREREKERETTKKVNKMQTD